MASNKSVPCGPCQRGEVNTKAEIWCYNCDEGLCSPCSSLHKKFKSTCYHKTIDIQTYKRYEPPMEYSRTECENHSQQFNLYCPSHLMPCCDECISTKHSKCTGIQSLASVVEKTKLEQSKESVNKDINSFLVFFTTMVNEKSRNVKKGEQQHINIKKSISKIRKEINKHLDHLERKLCKEADTIWDQEKSKLTDLITEFEEKIKTLEKMQDDLHSITVHTSNLHTFLGVHKIEQKLHQCKRYVEDMDNNEKASEVDITIKRNDEIEMILSELKSFGEVMVAKTEISLNREILVSGESQVESQEQSNINAMTMNIETTIEINTNKMISDMICLFDGRVIVVEMGDYVNILTRDGKLQNQLPISGDPLSVTQINQDTIAITYPHEKVIHIFNMKNGTSISSIRLNKKCWGLSYSNNFFAVGLSNDDEIRIIDLDGNTLTSTQVQSKSKLYHLVYCNDRVIYSDFYGNAVSCINESGNQIWQYKHDLSGPEGLCTDNYGNIIVTDYSSDRIIVISKDGQDGKVLIRKEHGLAHPKCICFKNNESYGYICDTMGILLAKFNLSFK